MKVVKYNCVEELGFVSLKQKTKNYLVGFLNYKYRLYILVIVKYMIRVEGFIVKRIEDERGKSMYAVTVYFSNRSVIVFLPDTNNAERQVVLPSIESKWHRDCINRVLWEQQNAELCKHKAL